MKAENEKQVTNAVDLNSRSTLTVSIVIEWENAILADAHRSGLLLNAVREQVMALPEQVEVLILHDPRDVGSRELATFIRKYLGPVAVGSEGVEWRLEAIAELHYYELKNEGARRVSGEILVFVDSDVIPQPYWLERLVQPFREDAELQLVTGNSWIDPVGMLGKAFAAGWFYGLPASLTRPQSVPRWIWANNVAYRRAQFLKAPFPAMPDGNTRDACFRQFQTYQQAGVPMLLQMNAEVSHPPPNGIKHFVLRGLAEGRDHCFASMEELSLPKVLTSLTHCAANRVTQAVQRCKSSKVRAHMRLPIWEIAPCLAVVTAYYTLYLLGATIALASPRRAADAWRI